MSTSLRVTRAGLLVDAALAAFLETEVLPAARLGAERFWSGAAAIFSRLGTENADLIRHRDELQSAIDRWHESHGGAPIDMAAYQKHLRDIGYLVPDPAPFTIVTRNVDAELAQRAGPQLVVPVLNPRFLLNAANARWGSLYNALYDSDVVDGASPESASNEARRDRVVAWAKGFLDSVVPLEQGRHGDVDGYKVVDGMLCPSLADATCFLGYAGNPSDPSAIVLRHNGLHIVIWIDRRHSVGRTDRAGVADIELESALTAIVDFEDSVVAVDAEDKLAGYRNWFRLMRGELETTLEKNGVMFARRLADERVFSSPAGAHFTLPGRSTLLVRNVGLHMMTSAVLLPDGAKVPEGILDALVTTAIAKTDLIHAAYANSRAGAVYVVKPKLHGPDEAAFTDRLFGAVEEVLGLAPGTVKIGLMDEERRTSLNLAACIHALRNRLVFINTGFLDRTGDEIHTAMAAGPVRTKHELNSAGFLRAYEERNVRVGLACGLAGRAQIGKGMWTMPNRMRDMIDQKASHPYAGASTAWVPSPSAATLHATHYHQIDVAERQRVIAGEEVPPLAGLLETPLAEGPLDEAVRIREIDANVQSILAYVVRWIEHGVGCSTVPDLDGVGLMEDRATLRISSQLLANWLRHGRCSRDEIEDSMRRIAKKVDRQNASNAHYTPMGTGAGGNLSLAAARALIFEGASAANGYTEPVLEQFRCMKKGRPV